VQREADGSVLLSNGLYVTGGDVAETSHNTVMIDGGVHVAGSQIIEQTLSVDEVRIKNSRNLSAYGDGYDYESRNTSAGGVAGGESYLGAGITWTYDAKERLKFTYKVQVSMQSLNTSNQAEWRLNLFGSSSYTGSVDVNDANLDITVVPAAVNNLGRQVLMGVHYMPPGFWPDGSVVYIAISAELLFATSPNWSRNSGGLSVWPASILKENIGYVP
jgi:hypothetical protein